MPEAEVTKEAANNHRPEMALPGAHLGDAAWYGYSEAGASRCKQESGSAWSLWRAAGSWLLLGGKQAQGPPEMSLPETTKAERKAAQAVWQGPGDRLWQTGLTTGCHSLQAPQSRMDRQLFCPSFPEDHAPCPRCHCSLWVPATS